MELGPPKGHQRNLKGHGMINGTEEEKTKILFIFLHFLWRFCVILVQFYSHLNDKHPKRLKEKCLFVGTTQRRVIRDNEPRLSHARDLEAKRLDSP